MWSSLVIQKVYGHAHIPYDTAEDRVNGQEDTVQSERTRRKAPLWTAVQRHNLHQVEPHSIERHVGLTVNGG